MTETMFRTIEPKILYFGTPVALISSLNEEGETNLAPMSSFWALGWNLVLGLLDETKTADNLRRHPECVVNLPSQEMWERVEKLAPLTGKNPVPEIKAAQVSGCGTDPACERSRKTHARERMPVHLEACITRMQELSGARLQQLGGGIAAEAEVVRVHVASEFVIKDNYIDAAKWSPLIYNFRHYFRLAEHELGRRFRAEA